MSVATYIEEWITSTKDGKPREPSHHYLVSTKSKTFTDSIKDITSRFEKYLKLNKLGEPLPKSFLKRLEKQHGVFPKILSEKQDINILAEGQSYTGLFPSRQWKKGLPHNKARLGDHGCFCSLVLTYKYQDADFDETINDWQPTEISVNQTITIGFSYQRKPLDEKYHDKMLQILRSGRKASARRVAHRHLVNTSINRVANAYLERQAQLQREAGLRDIWENWVKTPFKALIRNAPKFKKEAVDEVFDDIVREIAPIISAEVQQQVVEKLFLEFESGLNQGSFDSATDRNPYIRNHKLLFPNYKQSKRDLDWFKEGYVLGYSNPSLFKGKGKIDRKTRKIVMHAIIQQEEDDLSENVVGDVLSDLWDNINPVEVVKTIIKLVKKYGWKVGAALALVQVIESAVIPSVMVGLGHAELALPLSQLPITEVAIPIMARYLNIEIGDPDIPTDNLDAYIEDQGTIRLAAVSFNTFENTLAVLSKKLKVKAKIYEEDRDKSTKGNEFYAELGRNKISYDPVTRILVVNKKTFKGIDTKELLPTLAKNLEK